MRRDNNQQKIALAVGIALSAGMFSIMPSAYGAPVHDANSGITNELLLPATAIAQSPIKDANDVPTGGVHTEVTGNSGNNIVAWKDFSVGTKDVVQFDGGDKTNNYLNVVTGAATSQIDGKIIGGKEVYIVNPNGVIFGKEASVDVGSLYVSTEDISSAVNAATEMGQNPSAVLQAGTRTADVVNIGAINATNVQVEGTNIRFLNSANVTATGTNVVLNAASGGYVHVGNAGGTSAGYSGSTAIDYYKLINSASDLAGITDMSGNYMLSQNIDMKGKNHTPIGTTNVPFTGKFDGMFYEVQNLNVNNTLTRAGLFGVIKGTALQSARVDNLGVRIEEVTSTDASSYVGGLAGEVSSNVVIRNVYSEDGTVNGKKRVGGLVGFAGLDSDGTTYTTIFENVYNTSSTIKKDAKGSGIIGVSGFGVSIENAYNTNSNVENGITDMAYNEKTNKPKAANVFTTTEKLIGNSTNYTGGVVEADSSFSTYTDAGWTNISNDGKGNHAWRIYEGISTPILTAFLKGTVTADYKYNYFANTEATEATYNGLTLAGELSGANSGSDIGAIYNAQYLKVTDSTGKAPGTAANVKLTSNASAGDITVNTNGIRNVRVSNNTVQPQALISSGQHGYNIVGGNATINKRTVAAESGTFKITKEYDGTDDGTDAFGQALYGAGGVSFGGLLAGDDVKLDGVTATYNDGNVGTDKSVTVTVGESTGLSGTSADNYDLDKDSLNNLSVTGDITPRTIYLKLKKSADINKTYDGTTVVKDTAASAGTNIDIDESKGEKHNFVQNESGTLDTTYTIVGYNDKHAGAKKTIDYTKIALSGDYAQNYMLVVENSSSATGYDVLYDGYANKDVTDPAARIYGPGALQAKGKINQRVIDPTSFQVKDSSGEIANASKPYDGLTTFDSTGYTLVSNAGAVGDTGVVADDSIIFSIVSGQAYFKDAAGNNTSSATDSGLTTAAKNVGYMITAAANDEDTLLSDYTLNGTTLSNDKQYTVSGEGRIEKRAVNVVVNQKDATDQPISIDKEYDTTRTVKDAKTNIFGTGGYVDYAPGAEAKNKLTGNDDVTMKVSALYANKNAGEQFIDYTAELIGDNAANYDLNNTGTISAQMLGQDTGAKGVISPFNLGSSFAPQSKPYDGTTDVPGLSGTADLTSALTGVFSADAGKVTLQGKAAYESKNVKDTNWVNYTELVLGGDESANYTIADTAKGAGTITAKTLGTDDFEYTFGNISKEYEGTNNTALADAGSYITGITVKGTNDVIKDSTVNLTKNVTANFDNGNVQNGASHTVNYTLTIRDDGTGNYNIPSDGIIVQTATNKDDTSAVITPKRVIASIAQKANDNSTKTYDATTKLVDGQGNVLSGDSVITFKDLNGKAGLASGDSNGSTATYKDKNGDETKDAYAGDKNVLYTVTINTDDQTNYIIVNSNNQSLTNSSLTGTGTINKRGLTVTFEPTTKKYDGSSVVPNDADHIKPNLDDGKNGAVIELDGAKLDPTKIIGQYTGRANNADVGGPGLTVEYSNLQLALGDYADNYTISPTGKGTGEITTLTLTNDNFKFDFKTITKEYDGTQEVAYKDRTTGNTVTAESFISDHYVDMNGSGTYDAGDVLLQGITAQTAQYKSTPDSSTIAQLVKYKLILGTNLSNFDTSGLNNIIAPSGATLSYSNGVLTADTTGIITPRAVYASLNNTVKPSKPYDGNGNITQQGVNSNVSVDGLLGTDGTQLDINAINAAYVDDSNKFDADTREDYVTYNVQLTDGNLNNYKLVGASGTKYKVVSDSQGTLKGKGTIEKAPLTISFGDVSKEYDGSDNVLPSTISATLSGYVNGESDTGADAALKQQITGTYGTWDAANGVQGDANVNRQTPYVPNESYGYKGVVYQNINEALESYVNSNSTAAARNYYIDLDASAAADTTGNIVGSTVADTLYFKEAAQKGTIRPLAITADAIKEKWTGQIKKEYDGDELVKNANGALTDYLQLIVTKDINGTQQTINVPYTLLADNATYNGGKNVSTSDQGVTYKLSGLSAQAFGNFDISSADAALFDIAQNGSRATVDSTVTTYQAAGTQVPTTVITPKLVGTYLVDKTGIDKAYDSNSNADKDNAKYKLDDIFSDDRGTVTVAVTDAYYFDESANQKATNASAMPGKGNGAYTVKYEIELTGNEADNYTLVAGSIAQNTLTLTGKGDILKRKVDVSFAPNMDKGIDKDYNGKSDVVAAYRSPNRFALSEESGTEGILATEKDIVQLANTISAAYKSPNVQRKESGEVTTQAVTFSNFNLTGTSSGDGSSNYYLATKELTGSGTINPLTVTVSLNNAPKKEYDGNTDIAAAYLANDNFTAVPSKVVGTEDVKSFLRISGQYDDPNAGTAAANYADKAYTYKLSLVNTPNYDLVNSTSGSRTVTVGSYGQTAELKGSDGTIEPMMLTATVNGVMTKAYDGGLAGLANAEDYIKLVKDTTVLKGSTVGLVAKAVYTDDADAGISADSDELKKHSVKYTLNLSNNNYRLADGYSEIEGIGKISRLGLTIAATPTVVNMGEAMPKFTGSVTGFVPGQQDIYSYFINGISYKTNAGDSTSTPGQYAVYGWYNGKTDGNLGLNYTFSQAPANDTAFTVNYVDSGHNNPDTKVTPTSNIYQQISKDKGSGFGDNAAAALEYVDKNGQVIARETIDSGEIHDGGASIGNADDMTSQDTSLANIGIVGGDIVNVDGADAANMANIEVTDNGTTVNLEITSLSSGESGDKQAVAEITSVPAAADNSSAQIQNLDDRQDILEQITNKEEEQEKEGEIAIESKSSQNDDEIELTVEGNGVNVA